MIVYRSQIAVFPVWSLQWSAHADHGRWESSHRSLGYRFAKRFLTGSRDYAVGAFLRVAFHTAPGRIGLISSIGSPYLPPRPTMPSPTLDRSDSRGTAHFGFFDLYLFHPSLLPLSSSRFSAMALYSVFNAPVHRSEHSPTHTHGQYYHSTRNTVPTSSRFSNLH